MRSTRARSTVTIASLAALIALTGCSGDAKPPADSATTSSSHAKNDAEKQAAITDSEKTIRTAFAMPGLDPYPASLYTDDLVAEQAEAIASAKKNGQRIKGTDKVISIETESTSWDENRDVPGGAQVASTVCVERNGRWLDKDGNDIRGDQDGKPVTPGSRAQFLVRTELGTGAQAGKWLIDSIEEQGRCTGTKG